jgi:hypothetical protein
LFSGILDFCDVARCFFRSSAASSWFEKTKKKKFSKDLELFRANWRNSMQWTGPATLGAVNAGGRSGPRWTADAWLARRRRYSTARRDRAIT